MVLQCRECAWEGQEAQLEADWLTICAGDGLWEDELWSNWICPGCGTWWSSLEDGYVEI